MTELGWDFWVVTCGGLLLGGKGGGSRGLVGGLSRGFHHTG